MDPQIYLAIQGLTLALIASLVAGLAWVGKKLPTWVERIAEAKIQRIEGNLDDNTKLTKEARDLSNGKYERMVNAAQKYRSAFEHYEAIFRELSKNPEAKPLIEAAMEALKVAKVDENWLELQQRLLETPIETRQPSSAGTPDA